MTGRKPGRLCVITDTAVQTKYSHVELAGMALMGGADMIQLRDKKMSTSELIETALSMRELCRRKGVLFIVNDRVDIAIAADADGVHLGKDDLPIRYARKLMGNKLIGGTAHNMKEAYECVSQGADYIGFGHIYKTGSKIKKTKPKGISGLKKICREVSLPVLAIGGIGSRNVKEVINAGAHGVAVIGAVVKSKAPESAVRELRNLIYE